jgi:hypothetical protein
MAVEAYPIWPDMVLDASHGIILAGLLYWLWPDLFKRR